MLTCASCREDLQLEQQIYKGMAEEPAVEYMPTGSLKQLLARIDGLEGSAAQSGEVLSAAKPHGAAPWKVLAAAACFALVAVMVAFQVQRQPNYHTVTSPQPRVPDAVIRAVFSPSLTLVDLQGILAESHLRIVSGPTEAGVYSLAATTSTGVGESLNVLRRNPGVRFAESIRNDDARPASSDAP
jgi:hypothetical protein